MSGLAELETAQRREWKDEHGGVSLVRVPPRVGLLILEGRVAEAGARHWQEHFAWILSDSTLLFYDAEQLGFAGSSFISLGSSMTIDARPKVAELHVLVANVMIEMVAKTVNMSLGGFMKIHRKRDEFEAQLVQALAQQAG